MLLEIRTVAETDFTILLSSFTTRDPAPEMVMDSAAAETMQMAMVRAHVHVGMIHNGSLIDINTHYQTAQIIIDHSYTYRPRDSHLPCLTRVESTKTLEWPFSQLIFEIEADRRALHPESEGEERQSTERVQCACSARRVLCVSPYLLY